MTKRQLAYIDTLNLLGSDPLDPLLQGIVDREHALADWRFAIEMTRRFVQKPFVTD